MAETADLQKKLQQKSKLIFITFYCKFYSGIQNETDFKTEKNVRNQKNILRSDEHIRRRAHKLMINVRELT